jgi:hypothetical protein
MRSNRNHQYSNANPCGLCGWCKCIFALPHWQWCVCNVAFPASSKHYVIFATRCKYHYLADCKCRGCIECGSNSNSHSNDNQPPTLVCPANLTVNLAPGECCRFVSWAVPAASDNCPFVGPPTTLNTLNAGGNANSVGGVVFFNVNNISGQTLNITALGMNISAGTNVNIYVKSGTHVGFETNAGAWTLAGTANANTGPFSGPFPGNGTITTATVNGTLQLPPGLWGIGLHTPTAAQNYTNGNGGNQTYSNADITINLGSAANALWAAPFTPRVWNGFVRYQAGGDPDVVQVGGPANGSELVQRQQPMDCNLSGGRYSG